jgi:hypothetical protein
VRVGERVQLKPGVVPKLGQPLGDIELIGRVKIHVKLCYDGRLVSVDPDQIRVLKGRMGHPSFPLSEVQA